LLSSRSLKLAVLGLTVFAGGCDRQSGGKAQPQATESVAPTGPQAGDKPGGATKGLLDRNNKGAHLPDFTLEDPAGNKLRLSDLKGKPVLINLWATWCAPCVKELPLLDKLSAAGAVTVVTVSQDSADPQKVEGFLKTRGLKALPAWLDPKNDLSFHYGTGTLPTSIYYDGQGREVWRYIGERDWSDAETAKLLAEAL
jgi:thiol-disulfide isomerase/thioredoxin